MRQFGPAKPALAQSEPKQRTFCVAFKSKLAAIPCSDHP
jgi:hypothetical protein